MLGEGFVLDSLDKLNYCVARVALASTADRTEAYRSGVLLASSDGSVPPSPSKDDLDVSYYDLDPDEIFRVTKTVYFEIELKSEFGYLASMLGTGRTEVVITENSLETMITFRHGDRYFSCLLNGMTNDGGERTVEFTTHKYIEGYAIVKNFEQMNYSFSVTQRRNTVVDFTCRYSGSVSQNPMYAPDIASVIPGSTYVSDREVAFTLRSAQDFFGGAAASPETTTTPEPLPPETLTAIYTGHAHEFIFLDDGSFLYCNAFGDRTPLRIGVYQLVENDTHHGLFLKFTLQDGSVYATAFAPFIDESRAEFNYEGEFFRRARIDPIESEVAP